MANNHFHLIGLAGVAFLTPIALVQLFELLSSSRWRFFNWRTSSKRALLSKYSVINEENSNSVELPKRADVATWNAIGLQRPMVIAMVWAKYL